MRTTTGRIAIVVALICAGVALAGCSGSGGSGGTSANELLRVKDAQGFPDGKFFALSPSPPTFNQCIWIELTADVDPSTVFSASTENGLNSAVRMLTYYYDKVATAITPDIPLTRARLRGFAVLDGRTNLDFGTKLFRQSPSTMVTHASLHIDPNVTLTGKHGSFLVFVADTDGDPETIESFLPPEVGTNPGLLQNAQIMVNLTGGIRSTGGRKLDPGYITNFIVGATDQIPPVLDSVSPRDDESEVDIGSSIEISFSEPIEVSSLQVAGTSDVVPSLNPQVNLHVIMQILPPGQSVPRMISVGGSISPKSGQTTRVTFTPIAKFPGNTLVVTNVYSAASTLLGGPPPYHPGVIDPSGNILSPNNLTDAAYTFTTGSGPALANNPIDPEAIHFITTSSGMGTVRTNPLDRAATGQEDVVQEVNENGDVNQLFPGGVLDAVVGPFIANVMGTGSNTINDPPRQCLYWLAGLPQRGNPPNTHIVEPGKYTPPGIADDLLCTGVRRLPSEPPPYPPPNNWCPESITPGFQNIKPAEPLGVYLFVTNEAEDVVHCVSSHTFQILKDIKTPDPRGLGISPDLTMLYVSNFGANSMSVLDITAGPDGLPKGEMVRQVHVGMGPGGVAAQPNGEDVLVCNRLGKTVSVISVSNLGSPGDPVRVTMQSGDPYEVTAGARLTNLLLPYYGFVTNPGTNQVSIFESGPRQINGFGRDQVIDIIGDLGRPMGINGDQWFNTSTYQNPIPPNDSMTGAFVVMHDSGTVAHLKATRFSIPFFPNPPPALVEARFEIATQYKVGDSPKDVCVDNNIIYCSTPDGKQWPYVRTNPPVTVLPSRLYVSNGEGSIQVIEIRSGHTVTTLEAGGARKMFGYYSQ